MRLDQFLVEKKIVRSRSQAKDFILRGSVELKDSKGKWQKVFKPNHQCNEMTEVRLASGEDSTWVARSGLKLDSALERLGLSPSGLACLDLGQSTGGFTQSLLRRGAKQVVGVDVGHDQIAKDLREDDRVVCYEGVDARKIEFLKKDFRFDLIAVDLSFISFLKVLPSVLDVLGGGASVVVLYKPQFEVGKEIVGKTGLVQSAALQLSCQKTLFDALNRASVEVLDYFPSAVKGKNGNQEFICHFRIM